MISIKSSEDLQEALVIEMDHKLFSRQFRDMIERWGIDSAINHLAIALCGDGESLKPIIKFTHRINSTFEQTQDPYDYWVEEISPCETDLVE